MPRPIRHTDHIHPWNHHGKTTVANGQGLCVACNHAKQAPGWKARPGPDGMITTITPTGHSYTSRPPAPPGGDPTRSRLEDEVHTLLDLAWARAA